jgi:hypothetical protein
MNESAIIYTVLGCVSFGIGFLESYRWLMLAGFLIFGVGMWVLGSPDVGGKKYK